MDFRINIPVGGMELSHVVLAVGNHRLVAADTDNSHWVEFVVEERTYDAVGGDSWNRVNRDELTVKMLMQALADQLKNKPEKCVPDPEPTVSETWTTELQIKLGDAQREIDTLKRMMEEHARDVGDVIKTAVENATHPLEERLRVANEQLGKAEKDTCEARLALNLERARITENVTALMPHALATDDVELTPAGQMKKRALLDVLRIVSGEKL